MPNTVTAVRRDAAPALKRLDFESHFWDGIVDRCFGKATRKRARRLIQTPEFQEMLERNFMTGDVQSDRLVRKMRTDPEIRKDYQIAISSGIDAVDSPCPELVAFMKHAVNIPDIFDRDMIELGAHVFLTQFNPITFFAYGWPCALLQGPSVGITAAAWYTNQPQKPLTLLENVKRPEFYQRLLVRFMETFKWFAAVAQPGASQPYSAAFQENCRIRIIHSQIRAHMETDNPTWNFDPPIGWMVDELGTPLSAAEGSIVVTTLATAIVMSRRHLSQQISDREMEALFQFTSYLNYMQGVPEDLLFANVDDTALYFAAYLMTMAPDCTYESIEALIYAAQHLHLEEALFPDSKPMQMLLGGLMSASFDEIYGVPFLNYYNAKRAPGWAKSIFRSTKVAFRGINLLSARSHRLRALLDQSGLMFWNDIFPAAEERIKQHYAGIAEGTDLVRS